MAAEHVLYLPAIIPLFGPIPRTFLGSRTVGSMLTFVAVKRCDYPGPLTRSLQTSADTGGHP